MTRLPHKRVHDKRVTRSGRPAFSAGFTMLQPWRNYIFAIGLVLTTRLAHRPVWHGTPRIDDQTYWITKPELRSGSGLLSLWMQPQTTKQYHPLVNTVFWVGNKLWGDAMLGYHLVNIFLHSVSALLLWKILRRLDVAGAWLAAAVFALHPVQVASVAWLAELTKPLSGVVFFCCVLSYSR